MRVKVFCDKSGNIESVAVLSAAPAGHFHVEMEGGGAAHELEVDPQVIEQHALLGRKGPDAQKAAYEKLRQMI